MTLKEAIHGTAAPYSHATLTWGVKPSVVPLNGDPPTLTGIRTHWHWYKLTQAFTGKTNPPPLAGLPQNPQVPVGASSYRLRIGPVGAKLDGHGVEDAQLPCHLMHPPQGPLLIRVRKLHYQAGRGTLRQGEEGAEQQDPGNAPEMSPCSGEGPTGSQQPQHPQSRGCCPAWQQQPAIDVRFNYNQFFLPGSSSLTSVSFFPSLFTILTFNVN